ncbi:GNAT family N-acetyltransferase [Ruegeria meonggei]|uniref:GNAT family N-acetyltransferase n=1 Tax=Ruegeria meonggei TaxID=1446476 RepID=UPI0036730B60
MKIRPAIPSDASSLAALSIEVWLATYQRDGIGAFFANYALNEFTSQRAKARIADPTEFLAVLEAGSGLIGYVAVATDRTPPLPGVGGPEISTLYVQPRHQGKGVGKALLNTALQHCRELGGERTWLTTNSENTPAIDFYLSQGFEHIGTTSFRIQDQAYPNHVLELDLRQDRATGAFRSPE